MSSQQPHHTTGKSKDEVISERQANLPLPDQPPVRSDFNSADSRTVNVGSGGAASQNPELLNSAGIREPASAHSAARVDGDAYKTNTGGMNVGRTRVEGLDGPPSDAVAGGKKKSQGVQGTMQGDSGYPHESDPSSGDVHQTRRQV